MFRLLSVFIFYCLILCLYLLIAFLVGQGVLMSSNWLKSPINPDYALHWGHGVTLSFVAASIISIKLDALNLRRSLSKLYPITNENLYQCRPTLLRCIEDHLRYLADLIETIGNPEEHPGLEKILVEVLICQKKFKNIYLKMENHEGLTEDELLNLNNLLINKNIIIHIVETETR